MKSTYPGIDQNIIGEIPEIHATRVVGEMVGYLQAVSLSRIAQLTSAMNMPIGGSPKAQQRWAQRIHNASIPMLADFATCWGKRARFSLSLSIWDMDEHGGATVNHYLATSQGPGTERRSRGPLWRMSKHALVRLVQRSGATDAAKLMRAMRAVAPLVADSMAAANLQPGDKQVLYVKFPNGTAVVDWPADSGVAVVKTVLGPDMAHPLPGLH